MPQHFIVVEIGPPTQFGSVWSLDHRRYVGAGYGALALRRMGDPFHARLIGVTMLFAPALEDYRWKVGDELVQLDKRYLPVKVRR